MVTTESVAATVFHAGTVSSPVAKPVARVMRLILANTPGGLTNVAQVFSTLNTSLDRLEYYQLADASLATILASIDGDDRTLDLLCRKLERLTEVVEIELVAPPEGHRP